MPITITDNIDPPQQHYKTWQFTQKVQPAYHLNVNPLEFTERSIILIANEPVPNPSLPQCFILYRHSNNPLVS
jgi:hypothetical protein